MAASIYGGILHCTGLYINYINRHANYINRHAHRAPHLSQDLSAPIIDIGNFYNQLITCSTYLERILETLDISPANATRPMAYH
ncbi:MAG: hypothetical protein U0K19_02865 [Bifidobacteriaceae bacterium]|nr:hypothetical protein [Bifidobacteriaceae bacterium]